MTIRVPLLALITAVFVVAVIALHDVARLRAVQMEVDEITLQRDRTQRLVLGISRLRERVSSQAALLASMSEIRRGNLEGVNELATIGNALPVRAWLASLHSDGAHWTIDGATRDPQAISATLIALRAAPALHAPALVSLHTTSIIEPIDYQLRVDRRH